MAEKTAEPITVTLDETQRNIVLNGLINELLDSKRYLSGSKVDDEPGPLDSCCAGHLARYEQRKYEYRSLKQRKTAVEATIALFSGEEN